MNKATKVNIQGTEYEIFLKFVSEDKDLNNCDGYCDNHSNKIVVRDYTEQEREEDNMTSNLDSYINQCIRHEIIHAFIFQSGLSINSMKFQGAWTNNEEMVDWIAIQFPKILKIFQECNCI